MTAVAMAASFLTAAFGIGGGVIMLSVLAVLLPPAALIPVHGVVQVGSNTGRALILLRHLHRPALLPFGLGCAIGAGAGGAIYVDLPPWLIQFGIAGFVLFSVFGKVPPFGGRALVLSGAISSLLTMFFGATGVFVAGIVRSLGLPRERFVATHAGFMTLQHGLKVVAFAALGFAFGAWIWLIAAMIAAGFLGTLLGRQVLARMPEARFSVILNTILVLLALRLVWQGIETLVAGGLGT